MTDLQVKKILVIEDDKFYQRIYDAKLKKEGYETYIADNGLVGIELAKKHLPDLILLDLVMPQMDGFETLKKLREDPQTKDIKVIVASNLGQEEDMKKAIDAGAQGYMIKTNLALEEVMEKIKETI